MIKIPTLKKYKPKNEKELHDIIEKELDSLDEGLKILKYEFATGKGFSDFLAVDSEGRLIIIEVKLQEDKNILCQALRYYVEIERNRYLLISMFSKIKITPELKPRIILICERFSDDLRKQATLIEPDVDLFEYTVLITPESKKGINYKQVDLPKVDIMPPKIYKIEDHMSFIRLDRLKSHFNEMKKRIEELKEGIESYATKNYVGFKYKGRQIGWMETTRNFYKLGAHEIDEKGHIVGYPYLKIETGLEDLTEIFEKIKIIINYISK